MSNLIKTQTGSGNILLIPKDTIFAIEEGVNGYIRIYTFGIIGWWIVKETINSFIEKYVAIL